jgi:transposase InsO family protein
MAITPTRTTQVTGEIRELIRRMKAENPGWGAPRIHGELLQLGFSVSEPTVSRYLRRIRRRYDEGKAKRWLAFLNNHREIIVAFDFFTVPTLSFRTLYCFFVIEHRRRRLLHFDCSEHPTANWIVQQLREALPLPCPYRYVLFDRDAKFGTQVFAFLQSSGIEPVRTSLRSPWQNGIAERWVGSARRELSDHVIPLNEHHLRRLAREYLTYYHEDRTHITLDKSTPGRRIVESPLSHPSQSSLNLASAEFTIGTAGQRQPDRRYEKPHLHRIVIRGDAECGHEFKRNQFASPDCNGRSAFRYVEGAFDPTVDFDDLQACEAMNIIRIHPIFQRPTSSVNSASSNRSSASVNNEEQRALPDGYGRTPNFATLP